MTSAAKANFAENASGTVYTATGTDPDAGTTLSWTLGGADAALFDINSGTGAVSFKAAPNHEAPGDAGGNNVYDITVTASDGKLSSLAQAVAITVTNVNEAPTVAAYLGVSTATIPETAAEGRAVGRVTVSDPDASDSVNLSLVGPDAANFVLDGLYLRVAPGAVFDFDSDPSLSVTVRGTDLGSLTSDQAFTINVLDVVTQQQAVQAALGGSGSSVGLTVVVTDDGPQLQRGSATVVLSGLSDLTTADGLLGFGANSTLAGVERLFLGLMGRSTTGTEMMDAKEQLDHGATLSDIATGLLNGAEFSSYVLSQTSQPDATSLSTTAFVELMYNRILGRASDSPGLDFWSSILDNGLVSRVDVVLGFSNSVEAKAHYSSGTQALWAADIQAYQVRSLYDVAFNREPDAGGLAFWSSLMDQGLPIGVVADYIVASSEFQAHINGLTTTQVLQQFYQDGLERAADGEGLVYWTNVVDGGLADWSDVLVGFALSAEQSGQLESYRAGSDIFVA